MKLADDCGMLDLECYDNSQVLHQTSSRKLNMDKKRRIPNRKLPSLSKIEETINNAPFGWIMCFVSEDQSHKLRTIIHGLSQKVSETGDGKQIAPGLSYWGIG